MTQGIGTPWTRNKRGGLLITSGPTHTMGLLQIALGSGDSANPFQNLGLGEDMIFDPLDAATFAPVQERIRDIFEDFEDNEIAKLQARPDNLQIIETSESQAAILVFFVDIESGDPFAASVTGTQNGLVVSPY